VAKAFPDGIDHSNVDGGGPLSLKLRWFALFFLGAILALAMLGMLGGADSPMVAAKGKAGSLTIEAPATLRNGEFFEMHFAGQAHRALTKPTLAIGSSYWQHLTINTMIPAPASEAYEDGFFLFEFDPLEAGKTIDFKIDGQVNPALFGGTRGTVQWRDGDTVLAQTPVRLKVLP
jgi:hypothetical protein